MSSISKELSNKFANMALLCAMLVVLIHFHLEPVKGTIIWYVNTMLVRAIASIAVPFFFLTSGYFLVAHKDERDWWVRALMKRTITLIIPYLFWCCAFWAMFSLILPIACNISNGEPMLKNINLPSVGCVLSILGLNPFTNPGTPALWYVRALCMYVILTPLLLKLANRGGVCMLFVIYLIVCPSSALIKHHPNFFLVRFFFSLEGLFYFTLGMYLRNNIGLVMRRNLPIIIHLTGIVLLVAHLVASLADVSYRYYIVAIAIPCWMYSVWSMMPSVSLPRWLTDCSFPLFVMHQLFIALIAIVTHGMLAKSVCEASFVRTAMLFVIVVGVCVLISRITHKFKLLSLILWGGR